MTMTEAEPATTTGSDDAVAPPEAKKKRSNLLPALVLAAGMVVAAFLLKPSGTASAAGEATTTTTAAGAVVAIDPMTLNLSDGLIRIGVAIELSESADPTEFEEHGATNRLKDLVIFEVSGRTAAEVSSAEGLEELKRTLTEGAKELYHEEFHGLYLTDLVVQ
jgi:flagellar basal body-associated protein FliL